MILAVKNFRDIKNIQSNDGGTQGMAISNLQSIANSQGDLAAYRALEAFKQTKARHYLLAFLRFCGFEIDKAEKLLADALQYTFTPSGAYKITKGAMPQTEKEK